MVITLFVWNFKITRIIILQNLTSEEIITIQSASVGTS